LKLAYLVNDYPKVSHSFIRREVLALERRGFEVLRIAIRGWKGDLPTAADMRERERTRYVLQASGASLAWSVLRVAVARPVHFLRALHLTLRMSRVSDRSVLYHLAYLAEACRVLSWLREFGGQRIHAHFGTNSANVAMLAGILGDVPYSFTVHGPEEFLRPIGLAEKIRRAAFVVAISSFGRSQLYLFCAPSDWRKIHIVRCGLERDFYFQVPDVPADARRLVCVGRLAPEKGQGILLQAAAALAAKGVAFELVLAGDGPSRGWLQELIDTKGLGDKVRITGWLSEDEVRHEILAARALVLASFSEGLPVVIMEAMALARPVIATYVAGVPELVQNSSSGWLVPAASVDALVGAIEACLAAPVGELSRMGQLARARALANHDVETEAARLGELFRDTW